MIVNEQEKRGSKGGFRLMILNRQGKRGRTLSNDRERTGKVWE